MVLDHVAANMIALMDDSEDISSAGGRLASELLRCRQQSGVRQAMAALFNDLEAASPWTHTAAATLLVSLLDLECYTARAQCITHQPTARNRICGPVASDQALPKAIA